MKYKYVGENDCFCIELLAFKLVPKGSYLENGQIIEVPDDLTDVIDSMNVSGQFIKVQDDKKISKVSKKEKEGK